MHQSECESWVYLYSTGRCFHPAECLGCLKKVCVDFEIQCDEKNCKCMWCYSFSEFTLTVNFFNRWQCCQLKKQRKHGKKKNWNIRSIKLFSSKLCEETYWATSGTRVSVGSSLWDNKKIYNVKHLKIISKMKM